MLNTYYIVDRQTFLASINLFHPQLGSHGIDLPDGRILLSAHFPENHSNIEKFEAHPGVKPLPHPALEGTKPLSDGHVAALAHLGVVKGHTVLDVASRAAAIHPLMKMRHF